MSEVVRFFGEMRAITLPFGTALPVTIVTIHANKASGHHHTRMKHRECPLVKEYGTAGVVMYCTCIQVQKVPKWLAMNQIDFQPASHEMISYFQTSEKPQDQPRQQVKPSQF